MTRPLIGDAYVSFRADAAWQSKSVIPPNPVATSVWAPNAAYAPSHWVVNGRVALREVDLGGVNTEFAVWGKNIFDEDVAAYGVPLFDTVIGLNYIPARAYGFDVRIDF